MQVIELGQPCDGPIALALGYFDGMHLGHRTILNKAVELAAKYGARTAVTTFADSPNRTDPIYTYNERKKLFAECGAEICLSLTYIRICNMRGREFFDKLVTTYDIRAMVCGADHKFGSDGCDVDALASFCRERNIELVVMPLLDYGGVRVSSTAIKAFLATGDVDSAKKLLSEPYHISGYVVSGDGRGHNIGVPTANIDLPLDAMEIKRGVYGTYTTVDGKSYRSVTNYGARPTFMQSRFAIETNLMDYDGGDLRNKYITVYFHKYIRPIRKYPTAEALVERIRKDKEWTDL